MKTAKHTLALIAALALLTFTGGCITSKPISEQSLENKAKAITWIAVTKALQEKPEWELPFRIARGELLILSTSETIGLAEVLSIVNRLPVKELKSDDAALIVTGAMLFFQDELGVISIDNPPLLRAACRGMAAGITMSLPAIPEE